MTISNLLYLASPIDRVAEASDWNQSVLHHSRDAVHKQLVGYGFTVYRPDLAFAYKTPVDAAIDSVNSFALANASGVMVVWPDGIDSTGILHEIEFAKNHKIPVVQICGDLCNDPAALVDQCEYLCSLVNARAGQVPISAVRSGLGMTELPKTTTASLGQDIGMGTDYLRWRRTHAGAFLPTKSFSSDVGWDLYASAPLTIMPGEADDVPFNLQVAPPAGWWGRITGRSSTLRNRGLQVIEGVIDPGYTGELFANCFNTTKHMVTVEYGERIAQFILMPVIHPPSVEVASLPLTDRGASGYGSSGA